MDPPYSSGHSSNVISSAWLSMITLKLAPTSPSYELFPLEHLSLLEITTLVLFIVYFPPFLTDHFVHPIHS